MGVKLYNMQGTELYDATAASTVKAAVEAAVAANTDLTSVNLYGADLTSAILAYFAAGSITTVVGASLVDGETFVLNDGLNAAVTFEFDSNASVVQTPTLRAVTFTGGDTADQVRDSIIAAIAGAPALNITASSGGAGLVNLVNDNAGSAGNQTVTETVAAAGFVVTGMTGGALARMKRANLYGATLTSALAKNADLEYASLYGAKCGSGNFTSANCNSANLYGSDWTGSTQTSMTHVGAITYGAVALV